MLSGKKKSCPSPETAVVLPGGWVPIAMRSTDAALNKGPADSSGFQPSIWSTGLSSYYTASFAKPNCIVTLIIHFIKQ